MFLRQIRPTNVTVEAGNKKEIEERIWGGNSTANGPEKLMEIKNVQVRHNQLGKAKGLTPSSLKGNR